MIPDELDLDPVRFIGCRSQAEYETLWQLLSSAARTRWKPRIGLGAKAALHFKKWMFVDQVTMEPKRLIFQFNAWCGKRGPFDAKLRVRFPNQSAITWNEQRDLPEALTINLPVEMPQGAVVELRLDDRLAYRNTYEGTDKVL
jgi:hypothetical protein